MSDPKSRPAPSETGPGDQKDDNIDDLGRRQDGTEVDQPVDPGTGADEPGGKDNGAQR